MDQHALENRSKAVAAQAVELARRHGADQAEVGVSYEEGLSVTVRMGELESVERQRDRGLAITVYRDSRKGSASTTDFSAASVEDTVRKALSIGSFTAADEYAGLADAELMAKTPPDLELYFPWDVDVDQATELALRSENAARVARRAHRELRRRIGLERRRAARLRKLARLRRRATRRARIRRAAACWRSRASRSSATTGTR